MSNLPQQNKSLDPKFAAESQRSAIDPSHLSRFLQQLPSNEGTDDVIICKV